MSSRIRLGSIAAAVAKPLLVACLAAAVGGCTLVGLGLGARSDKNAKKTRKTVTSWQFELLKVGDKVDVQLLDGGHVTGKYAGLDQVPAEEYAQVYARSREAADAELPPLGARVKIVTNDATTPDSELLGFDPGQIVVRRAKALWRIEVAKTESILDQEGGGVAGPALARLMNDGKLPFLSRLAVENNSGRVRVPFTDVAQVAVVNGGNAGKVTGLLVGAAVDTAIIIAATHESNPPPPPTCSSNDPNCVSSCPFVYSFDGEHYVLDAEGFGGAIFESAAKPDWATLSHLRGVAGEYRLRLTDEQQEIQYVDEVRLLAVDGPPGARIVPSVDGTLHAFVAPIAPVRATDASGADVRPSLRGAGARWTSRPVAWNPDGSERTRDGLVLEFPRPAGARSVKLGFNVQSTPWASVLGREVLSLQGGALPAWYARMNSDGAARLALLGALARETLLDVRIWDGAGWRRLGFLPIVGPAVSRDIAVVADLGDIPGLVLRVRVDSSPGLWIVNGAVADYSPEVALDVTELAPLRARAEDGTDLRAILSGTDGRYHVMHPGRDAVDVVFAMPPLRDGRQRSIVAQTSGYYTALVPAEGEPQTALYDRLVREPGAFAHWSQGLLRLEMRQAVARHEGL